MFCQPKLLPTKPATTAQRIYLDNAATTPMDPEVVDVMIPMMREHFGNPSSTHANGRKVKNVIEESRGKIASLLKCSPGEIFFTSGGTEADNLALRGSVANLGVKTLITSPIEHHAVLHTAEDLHKVAGINLELVNILPNLLIFEIPGWLENILEQFVSFLSNDIVMRLTDPDIMYFATIIILDLLIERKLFKLSKLVRYNILLVFALLMLQGITIAFWDALFNRQILESAADWCWDDGAFIHTDKELLIVFFTITFFTYVGIYIYCWFISAFYGNFPIFGQKFLWLTDSIFFWLKIRTSTMKYGKRKKK